MACIAFSVNRENISISIIDHFGGFRKAHLHP
ncbi:MAG: hypothetical protein ACI9BD_000793, partial [Candidatus Marinamargulisbacteria bacterium]